MRVKKFIPVLFLIASVAFTFKALALFYLTHSRKVDGDGIGIYFLGIEINDAVLYEQIPRYAGGFFISGLSFFLVTFVLFVLSRENKGTTLNRG